MRKLIASDVFAALRVVSAIEKKQGIETTIKDLVKNAENETKDDGDDKTAKERNRLPVISPNRRGERNKCRDEINNRFERRCHDLHNAAEVFVCP